jgi:ABC-type dipeptide/oligopeptide/nickel transport system permease subunit
MSIQRITARTLRNPVCLIGSIFIALVVLAAALAPALAQHGPTEQPDERIFRAPPSREHWLGTDAIGRDVLTRVLWGARTTLWIAFCAMAIAIVCGAALGILAGMSGGWLDSFISRATDFLLSFPAILLGLFLLTFLPRSAESLIIAVGIAGMPTVIRQMRAAYVSEQAKDYVLAARAVGASRWRIAWREILPNCLGLLLVLCAIQLATAVLESAGLSFLGLSGQPDVPEWGAMLQQARAELVTAPWLSIAPGLAIALTVLGFNLLSDGLRDIMGRSV